MPPPCNPLQNLGVLLWGVAEYSSSRRSSSSSKEQAEEVEVAEERVGRGEGKGGHLRGAAKRQPPATEAVAGERTREEEGLQTGRNQSTVAAVGWLLGGRRNEK